MEVGDLVRVTSAWAQPPGYVSVLFLEVGNKVKETGLPTRHGWRTGARERSGEFVFVPVEVEVSLGHPQGDIQE